MSEVFWRDLKYIQRDVEDKKKFDDNWDLIFKKDKEEDIKTTVPASNEGISK